MKTNHKTPKAQESPQKTPPSNQQIPQKHQQKTSPSPNYKTNNKTPKKKKTNPSHNFQQPLSSSALKIDNRNKNQQKNPKKSSQTQQHQKNTKKPQKPQKPQKQKNQSFLSKICCCFTSKSTKYSDSETQSNEMDIKNSKKEIKHNKDLKRESRLQLQDTKMKMNNQQSSSNDEKSKQVDQYKDESQEKRRPNQQRKTPKIHTEDIKPKGQGKKLTIQCGDQKETIQKEPGNKPVVSNPWKTLQTRVEKEMTENKGYSTSRNQENQQNQTPIRRQMTLDFSPDVNQNQYRNAPYGGFGFASNAQNLRHPQQFPAPSCYPSDYQWMPYQQDQQRFFRRPSPNKFPPQLPQILAPRVEEMIDRNRIPQFGYQYQDQERQKYWKHQGRQLDFRKNNKNMQQMKESKFSLMTLGDSEMGNAIINKPQNDEQSQAQRESKQKRNFKITQSYFSQDNDDRSIFGSELEGRFAASAMYFQKGNYFTESFQKREDIALNGIQVDRQASLNYSNESKRYIQNVKEQGGKQQGSYDKNGSNEKQKDEKGQKGGDKKKRISKDGKDSPKIGKDQGNPNKNNHGNNQEISCTCNKLQCSEDHCRCHRQRGYCTNACNCKQCSIMRYHNKNKVSGYNMTQTYPQKKQSNINPRQMTIEYMGQENQSQSYQMAPNCFNNFGRQDSVYGRNLLLINQSMLQSSDSNQNGQNGSAAGVEQKKQLKNGEQSTIQSKHGSEGSKISSINSQNYMQKGKIQTNQNQKKQVNQIIEKVQQPLDKNETKQS